MPDSLMVAQKKEKKEELPKIGWTIKKVENALRLPEEDSRRFKGEGARQNYYVARYVMQSKDIAKKIKEINAVEGLVRQKVGTRARTQDYARAINLMCNTEEYAKDFVANPAKEFEKLARVVERVVEDWYQHASDGGFYKFADRGALKKLLTEINGYDAERAKGYGTPAARPIEFDAKTWDKIDAYLKKMTPNKGNEDALYFDSKDGRHFIIGTMGNDGFSFQKTF